MSAGKHAHAAGAVTLGLTLALTGSSARADEAVEGPGVEVSPGTVVHPNIGAEAGVVNNVFFEQSDSGPVTSGLLRISGRFDLASRKIEPEEPLPGEEPGKEPAPQTFTFTYAAGATPATNTLSYTLTGTEFDVTTDNCSGTTLAAGGGSYAGDLTEIGRAHV